MNETKFTAEDIEKNKDLAALGYVWVFSVIVLLARRDSLFARFHAKQGFVLFLLSVVLWPFEIARYGEYLVLPLMVLGFIEAAQGRAYAIPVIAELTGASGDHSLSEYLHLIYHGFIRLFKPAHVTPEFREAILKEDSESQREQALIGSEKQLLNQEEKKLSALLSRLESDEKEIQHMKEEIHAVEEKVDARVKQ